MNNICPLEAKYASESVSFFSPPPSLITGGNHKGLAELADGWGILTVWFGQVGWKRVGVVYCKQNTVI